MGRLLPCHGDSRVIGSRQGYEHCRSLSYTPWSGVACLLKETLKEAARNDPPPKIVSGNSWPCSPATAGERRGTLLKPRVLPPGFKSSLKSTPYYSYLLSANFSLVTQFHFSALDFIARRWGLTFHSGVK